MLLTLNGPFQVDRCWPGGFKLVTCLYIGSEEIIAVGPGGLQSGDVHAEAGCRPYQACAAHLHLFNGTEHPYDGQKPQPLDVASMNRKNKVSA